MPANLTTLPTSRCRRRSSLAKSATGPGSGSLPRSAIRVLIKGSASAALTSRLSRSTISAGVALGAPIAEPAGHLEARNEFADRRNVRQHPHALRRRYPERAQRTRLDLRHRRPTASNMTCTSPARSAECAAGVPRKARAPTRCRSSSGTARPERWLRFRGPARAQVDLAGIGLGIGDELGNGLRRERRVHQHDERIVVDARDRDDVACDVDRLFS